MNRVFAIYTDSNDQLSNAKTLISTLRTYGITDTIIVFSTYVIDNEVDGNNYVVFDESLKNDAARRNFIVSWLKTNGYNDFAHVIHATIKFNHSPESFIRTIERTMRILDYPTWFSTVTDKCNYVITKYNPRMKIVMDKPEFAKLDLPSICFTSHANVEYCIFDLACASDSDLRFDERFSIPMFFIIEYFARRRQSNPDSLCLMNQYMTIDSEAGLFVNVTSNSMLTPDVERQLMPIEDNLFKSLNINYQPDNNLDMVLERLYDKICSKLEK